MIRDTADIAIVGAGIAGLTTALALARLGRASVVYEKARVLSEAGAGIQLSPNASRILIDLGLERLLERHVVVPESIVLHAGDTGRALYRLSVGETALERYGAPYWVVHRADLQDVLVKAVMASPNIILKRGSVFTHLSENGTNDRVTVSLDTLSGVETRNHDAVIGADGLWSKVRIALGDESRPRYSGFRAYRAVVPRDVLPASFHRPVVGAWVGREGHVVHYPVIGGFAVNLVAIVRDPTPSRGWGDPAKADAVTSAFGTWCADVRDALDVPGETWRTWALHDRPPMKRWSRGPVTLIGDAAHPMLPFLAQGGALGIEDGHELAEEMAAHPGRPDVAFAEFERRRHGRTRLIQRAARKNGRIFHMAGLPAMMRDLVLRVAPEPLMVQRQDWIYGYRR